MTKEEYLKAKVKTGHQLVESNGVWWEAKAKGYCKTAIPYELVPLEKAKPGMGLAWKGFNHRIENEKKASGFWKPFVMDGEQLSSWSLETLESGNRRRRIKKGLAHNVVEKLNSLDGHQEAFSRILKSTAIRNGHGHPPEYYEVPNGPWWKTIERVFEYTEFWCAFQNGKMAGYICLHVMGDRVIVDGVKSDTDMLPDCPMDAIIYHFLVDLQKRGGINEIWYGGKSNRPTLDAFKESFGFKVKYIPFRTRFLGGLLPYPKWLNRYIKRGDDEQ